ncbi:MAG: lysylphosphatidylglycerol synthase domain-containing protein, partial [Ruminococcus sp.]
MQTNPNSGARTAPKEKLKFKISGTVVFNILVAIISVYLVINFIVSEDGLIDLLKSPDTFHWGWVVVGLLVFDCNMIIDAIVTQIYLRAEYPHFRFLDSLKVAFVGVFFGAVTPSNTGGQPMQLYFLSRKNVRIGYGSACMTQKF